MPTDSFWESSGKDESDEAELRISLASAIAGLSPVERAVIVWRFLDDLPVADVAERMGRSEGWVRTTTHRAMLRLRADDHLVESDVPAEPSVRSTS